MLQFTGMPQSVAEHFRAGKTDAYDNPPERQLSDGSSPCRCCLRMIAKGAPMLVFAYRPFVRLHAYTETGPVFICADHCAPEGKGLPDVVVSPDYLLKAYSKDERIIYGTGQITPSAKIESYAAQLLARCDVAFVDLRSAKNNCWQARISRG